MSTKKLTQLCALMLQTEPSKYGAEDFDVMDNRQHILDALYMIDGRDNPNHKLHSLYTGLWKKYFKA
jgi:hypothetical protein